MTVSNETKTEFIKLRASGKSYRAISQELNVSTGTLVQWGKELSKEIHNCKSLELEHLLKSYGICKQKRLEKTIKYINKLDEELSKRNFKSVSTEKLLSMYLSLNNSIDNEQLIYRTGKYNQPGLEIFDVEEETIPLD